MKSCASGRRVISATTAAAARRGGGNPTKFVHWATDPIPELLLAGRADNERGGAHYTDGRGAPPAARACCRRAYTYTYNMYIRLYVFMYLYTTRVFYTTTTAIVYIYI